MVRVYLGSQEGSEAATVCLWLSIRLNRLWLSDSQSAACHHRNEIQISLTATVESVREGDNQRKSERERESQLQADFEVVDEDAHHSFVFFAFVMSTQQQLLPF